MLARVIKIMCQNKNTRSKRTGDLCLMFDDRTRLANNYDLISVYGRAVTPKGSDLSYAKIMARQHIIKC